MELKAQMLSNPELIVEKYGDTVYKVAFSRMKTKEDSEDIFQEVFLRLVRSEVKYESEEHLKAWLIRVTINCCNSHFGSAYQRHRADPKYLPEPSYVDEPNESDILVLDKYKADMSAIEVPQQLVDQTVALMKHEQEAQKSNKQDNVTNKSKSKLLSLRPMIGIAASVLIVLSSVFIFSKTNSSIIVTKLDNGVFVKQVELKNGSLNFDDNPIVSHDLSPSFAGGGTSSEKVTLEEYENYLGRKIAPDYLPKEMVQSSFSAKVISHKEKIIYDMGNVEYSDDLSKRKIALMVSKDSVPPDTIEYLRENSSINGVEIYLAILRPDDRWYAHFSDKYGTYTITADGISQEEFILFLNGIVKQT